VPPKLPNSNQECDAIDQDKYSNSLQSIKSQPVEKNKSASFFSNSPDKQLRQALKRQSKS